MHALWVVRRVMGAGRGGYFAGDVLGAVGAFGLCELVKFVEADDAGLGARDIVVGILQQAVYCLVNVFADVACRVLGQLGMEGGLDLPAMVNGVQSDLGY